MRGLKVFALVMALGMLGGACAGGPEGIDEDTGKVILRLGYFPNMTHATAIVGVQDGIFARTLGDGVELKAQTFNAGGLVVESLFAKGLDAAYVGPNPAINAFAKSGGRAIRVLAGATSGGAYFVVKPSIDSAEDLRGKRVASPQVGNTQDVALRTWLNRQGLSVEEGGKPEVEIISQENAQTLETFRSGAIEGAWVPEPWASRLVLEAGGKVLVDEKTLWPGGQYVTTHLIVRTSYLEEHPEVVEALVRGHVEANDFIASNGEDSKRLVGSAINRLTGRELPKEVVDRAWANLTFTVDPLPGTLRKSAERAAELGFIDPVDLKSIYNVSYLNNVLKQSGKSAIKV
ncbi:MAG: ABC transporter substrate-binding protein [Actinomycetota bacterium]